TLALHGFGTGADLVVDQVQCVGEKIRRLCMASKAPQRSRLIHFGSDQEKSCAYRSDRSKVDFNGSSPAGRIFSAICSAIAFFFAWFSFSASGPEWGAV